MTFHFFKAMFRLAPKTTMVNDGDKHHTDARAFNHGAYSRQLAQTKTLAVTCSSLQLPVHESMEYHYFPMRETFAPDRAGPNWDTDFCCSFPDPLASAAAAAVDNQTMKLEINKCN